MCSSHDHLVGFFPFAVLFIQGFPGNLSGHRHEQQMTRRVNGGISGCVVISRSNFMAKKAGRKHGSQGISVNSEPSTGKAWYVLCCHMDTLLNDHHKVQISPLRAPSDVCDWGELPASRSPGRMSPEFTTRSLRLFQEMG